jgi:hypothetical protein
MSGGDEQAQARARLVKAWRELGKPNLWALFDGMRQRLPGTTLSTQEPSYSQCGEDHLLHCFLRGRGLLSDYRDLFYVDIGANHPIANSNTWLFYTLGSRGLLVEPNRKLHPLIESARPEDVLYRGAVSAGSAGEGRFFESSFHEVSGLNRPFLDAFISEKGGTAKGWEITGDYPVELIHINELLRRCAVSKAVNLLSIDVEGDDTSLLEHCDFSIWRPDLVIAEPSDEILGVEAGSRRIARTLQARGYEPLFRTRVNCIYVRSDWLAAPQ